MNSEVLAGTEHEPHAVPGEFREHSVGVHNYKAVPAEDVPWLTEQTLQWVSDLVDASDIPSDARFGQAVIASVVAHAYLAWIHPFGDGNGRTARLVEAQLLARTGRVPLPAINLLSDHYNRTRDRHFRIFNEARMANDLTPFIMYAVEGLRDGLREQVAMIRREQLRITWQNFVHESFDDAPNTETRSRQKELVFALAEHGPAPRSRIELLTPSLAAAYAIKGDKTLSRDLNALVERRLIRRVAQRGWYASNQEIIEAWLPARLDPLDPELDARLA
ncbi:MAG: Fic family protein [Candidatus Nanopelagicales bacterium]